MRVGVKNPLGSARPTRAGLLATIFAILTAGLAVPFGLTDDEHPTVEAGELRDAGAVLRLVTLTGTTATTAPPPSTVRKVNRYEPALSELAVHDALSFQARVLSAPPPEEPAAPTTEAPTTTAPPTTAAPTTAAPTTAAPTTAAPTTAAETTEASEAPTSEEATAPDATDPAETTETTAADAPEPTDTTAPTETTEAPSTTTHSEGWVDAGHGVYVPEVLLRIRYCESRDNYTAANPSSSARGAYQFLTSSWAAYGHRDRYGVDQAHLATPAQQDEAALITWQRDGTRPWNASRSCWG